MPERLRHKERQSGGWLMMQLQRTCMGCKVLSVGESAWVRDCALSEGGSMHVSSGEHIL